MDEFEKARLAGLSHLKQRQGIGTLGERSLHSILKYWADPDDSHHEIVIGVGRIVADIFDGERVIEIQTRNFRNLRTKLDRLLPLYPVTVIYPIARVKKLIWVNPETGESTSPRKSPKTGRVWDAFPELYQIRQQLLNPQLSVKIVFLDMEEYKFLNGWSSDKKKGSSRFERIPTALCEILELSQIEDYSSLLPADLPNLFTSADIIKQLKTTRSKAGYIINVLYTIGAIKRTGKRKNAFLYEKNY